MSVFNTDLGEIIKRAEARRYRIEAVQRKLKDLSAVAHALESELKFIAELGEDVKALDDEAWELMGRGELRCMVTAGEQAQSTLNRFYAQGGSLRQVLVNLGAPNDD